MQRALDAGAVIVAELTDVVGDVLQVGRGNRVVREQHLAPGHARLRLTTQIQDDLEQLARVYALMQRAGQVGRQGAREQLDLFVPVGGASLAPCFSH